jgi:hypothetical protein
VQTGVPHCVAAAPPTAEAPTEARCVKDKSGIALARSNPGRLAQRNKELDEPTRDLLPRLGE